MRFTPPTPISYWLHELVLPTSLLAEDLAIEKTVAIAKAEALIDLHHPARLLPSEILQEIFTFFVERTMSPTFEELATGNFVDSRDLHAGPWLLSRVSSRWRSIVFAMPHLWTRINLNLDREKHASRTLSEFHKKSSLKAKYHINIYSQRSDSIEDDRIFSLCFLRNYYEWQSFGLSLPGAAFFGLSYPGCEYASLEDVRVHIQSPTTEEEGLPVIPPTGPCLLLAQAPRLRSLTVNNVVAFRHIFRVKWDLVTRFELAGSVERAFHDDYVACIHEVLGKFGRLEYNVVAFRHIFRVKWDLVTRFELAGSVERAFHDDYVACIHEVLGKFGRLEYASLHPADRYDPLPTVQSHCENASLRYLTLGANELLLNMDLPSLETLHFADPFSSGSFPKPLGPRTGGSIKELSIFVSEEPGDVSALIAFLRSTPNLCILEIRSVARSLGAETLCTSILAEDGLVPHLKMLRLRGADTTRVLEVGRANAGKERQSAITTR